MNDRDTRKAADIQHKLGIAYSILFDGDRQANLERAITAYQAALQIYTQEAFPAEWAATQHDLGNAYSRAKYYQKALIVAEQILEINPDSAFAYNDKGNALYGLGR